MTGSRPAAVRTAPAIARVGPPDVDATVLICTFNRASQLGDTLDSLAQLPPRPGFSWDVLVVDNNSTDGTSDVVASRTEAYPVRLRYLFEGRQGKSNALNTGLAAARARIVVFTDDDVRVSAAWLQEGVVPLLTRDDIEYTGGPVRPIWGAPRPDWLDEQGNLGGTIAVKDHGPDPFVFEDAQKSPLGVNMAVRRRLIEQIGGFNPELGRNGRSLLGQEQAEFFYRSRLAGARGLYVPGMVVDHVVPATRLTRDYFRRWWYWKGVSHARVHRLYGRTEIGLDIAAGPRLLGVPRFIFGNILRNAVAYGSAWVRQDATRRIRHGLSLAYYAGYCREAWRRVAGSRNGAPLEYVVQVKHR